MPVHSIHDTRPADRWEDAFLSGNGEYGIMVFGHPHRERIVHNHHRYVLPNDSLGMRPPAVADRLEDVRDLVLAGDRERAQGEFSDGRALTWTQSFHPGHMLHIDAQVQEDPVERYRRVTDFAAGQVRVTWSDGQREWARRAFVSRTDAVAVLEITGPWLDLAIRLSGECPGARRRSPSRRPPSPQGTVRCASPLWGPTARAWCGGFRRGDPSRRDRRPGPAEGDAARIEGASRVLLLTRMDRSAPLPRTDDLHAGLAGLPADYDELLARHAPVHGELYARAELDLGAPAGDRGLPVGELIARADPKTLDGALAEAMFHSGRYLLLSSSGVLPPRLTGLWLGAWGAAWSGDYTTDANINLQMAGQLSPACPSSWPRMPR